MKEADVTTCAKGPKRALFVGSAYGDCLYVGVAGPVS
jgi:hypothetical protein